MQKKSIIDVLQGPKYGTYGCFCESVCKQEIIYSLSSDVYLVISLLIQKRHRPTWQHELQTNQKVVWYQIKQKNKNDLILTLFNYLPQQPTKNNRNLGKPQKIMKWWPKLHKYILRTTTLTKSLNIWQNPKTKQHKMP